MPARNQGTNALEAGPSQRSADLCPDASPTGLNTPRTHSHNKPPLSSSKCLRAWIESKSGLMMDTRARAGVSYTWMKSTGSASSATKDDGQVYKYGKSALRGTVGVQR